ncbi:MAG: thermonuclease family protein [Ignavibacterium sp.]|nr:thermonuclease family protein [Ignavibacterium sp.]
MKVGIVVIYKAVVNKVIDGDTIEVVIFVGIRGLMLKEKIRIADINAPEINTTEGQMAKQKLSELIEGKQVDVSVYGTDKYGRLLGHIYYNNINISEWLVENKYAEPYL